MKKDIHPTNYRLVAFKDMSNEEVFITKSCADTKDTLEVYLKKNSLLCLTKESRYDWRHTIPNTKSFVFNGKKFLRDRRLSLTCRFIKKPLS